MSIDEQLTQVRQLRDQGLTGQYVVAARDLANQAPAAVGAQIEAAYACDAVGDEEAAIFFYDRAWKLGVPEAERPAFCVGYGSTLKNVGRLDESLAVLGEALQRYPTYSPIKAFLALSLHEGRHHNAAMATLLGLILELGSGDELDGFGRALAHYQTELIRASLEDEP